MIPPATKNKIEDIINVFESGSINGNYATLVKYKDYTDPSTHINIVQITYGRSQTTEFGNLKSLVQMYVDAPAGSKSLLTNSLGFLIRPFSNG